MDAVKVHRPRDWASRGDKHRNTFYTFCRCHRDSVRFDQVWVLQPEPVELKFSPDLHSGVGVVIARTKTSAGFEASLFRLRGGGEPDARGDRRNT
jgi:hypothetical protein